MKTIENENVIGCDVDGTLILSPNGSGDDIIFNYYGEPKAYRPHRKHIELLKAYKARGFYIIVHSNNGHKWCDEVVDKLGLREYIGHCMTKFQKVLDDEPIEKWCKTIFIPEE